MSTCLRSIMFAGLSIIWCGLSASAETLRCQSINGNLNCAGSSGASCQTVDGKTVCSSAHGDVVQSFGNGRALDRFDDAAEETGHRGHGDMSPATAIKERLEQYHHQRRELMEQDETRSLPPKDWLSINRD
jgi:hypothetical protein